MAQLPFTLSPGSPLSSSIFRGYLWAQKPTGQQSTAAASTPSSAFGDPGQTFRFQLNPNDIQIGYDSALVGNPAQTDVPGNFATAIATVTWQCPVDRTADVVNGSAPDGVFNDIRHLQAMYGLFADPGAGNPQQAGGLTSVLSTVVFSGSWGSGDPSQMKFTGRLNQLGVEMTFFSPKMIPLRAIFTFSIGQVTGITDTAGAPAPTK